ncbi:MAG: hypothetical protein JSU90_10760 [Nitrospiraceae bacterium]|nr:MAG: hypothetical protein JSU90_10760 [Nitrospiraceae bacterium]
MLQHHVYDPYHQQVSKPGFWRLKPSDKTYASKARIKTEKKFGLKEEQRILCKKCITAITSPEHIITVNDHHRHTFSNPAGITYHIGCFSAAVGCLVHGAPTIEHTWFAGFRWSFALCSGCLIHLGWYYQNGDESFFGLILDLLVGASAHY